MNIFLFEAVLNMFVALTPLSVLPTSGYREVALAEEGARAQAA